jgi:hypothetical protein
MPYCPNCRVEYRQGFSKCSECGAELMPGPLPQEVIGPEWVPVAVFATREEGELARGYLEAEGVPAGLVDQELHMFQVSLGNLGEVVLTVPPGHEGQARFILTRAEQGAALLEEGEDTDTGSGDGSEP